MHRATLFTTLRARAQRPLWSDPCKSAQRPWTRRIKTNLLTACTNFWWLYIGDANLRGTDHQTGAHCSREKAHRLESLVRRPSRQARVFTWIFVYVAAGVNADLNKARISIGATQRSIEKNDDQEQKNSWRKSSDRVPSSSSFRWREQNQLDWRQYLKQKRLSENVQSR